MERINTRPPVQRGLAVPEKSKIQDALKVSFEAQSPGSSDCWKLYDGG